jgi:glutathione synthase/RimK-type ligase-like ATP-grasp enzyme
MARRPAQEKAVILVWGESGDPPVARVLDALADRGAAFCHLDNATLAQLQHELRFADGVSGWLQWPGAPRLAVTDIEAAYVRPGEARDAAARAAAVVMIGLLSFLPGRIVNPPSAGRSNHSKPYQLGLIEAAGLEVPDTLLTTDPEPARGFLREHRRVIYKSLSGVRSIVASLSADEPADLQRLDQVRSGPVQLQAQVQGLDVRVHVVGERCFACAAESAGADYRYAPTTLRKITLPAPLGRRLVKLARGLDLQFAGVDLRRTDDGRWVCFEVNPSPGFPWYEDVTGQPIAESVAALLAGETP